MRDRTKFIAALAALAIGGAFVTAARASTLTGDYTNATINTGVWYYSVDVSLGQRFFVANPSANGDIFVDDITYSVDLDPCNPEDRCALLDFTVPEEPNGTHGTGTIPLEGGAAGNANPGLTIGPSYGNYYYSQTVNWFVAARGTVFIATMTNQTTNRVFDRVSHTMYGQMIGVQIAPVTYYMGPIGEIGANSRPVGSLANGGDGSGQGSVDGGYFPSPNPLPGVTIPSAAEVESVQIALCAVNTSESRHYQTPEIVPFTTQNLNGVQFTGVTGTGISSYTHAKACVKGRVIYVNTANLPLPQRIVMGLQ